MPPRFPVHRLTSEPALTTAAREAKSLCVFFVFWRSPARDPPHIVHGRRRRWAAVCARLAAPTPFFGSRRMASIEASLTHTCPLSRAARGTDAASRPERAGPQHHYLLIPLTLPLPKKTTHRWPFLGGLGASGAVFFKVATSVTGACVCVGATLRVRERERVAATHRAFVLPLVFMRSHTRPSSRLRLPALHTHRRGHQALQCVGGDMAGRWGAVLSHAASLCCRLDTHVPTPHQPPSSSSQSSSTPSTKP